MYDLIGSKNFAKKMNDRIFTDYYYRLMLIARSRFDWNGLPNNIDYAWIERYLYSEGACVFYKDPVLGFMIAKMGTNGPLNAYNEPVNIQPIADNYYYEGPQLVNGENCVIIKNNSEMIPTLPTIELYAYKLMNIDRTIDININQQKIPLIVQCSDKQRFSLKQVISQRNDNEFIIWGDKNLDLSGVHVLKTEAPIIFDQLEIQKHMIYNECMTFLGVNNANQDKRERLVSDEVSANDQQIQVNNDVSLEARIRACKMIKEVFGLDISVNRKKAQFDLLETENEVFEEDEAGEEEENIEEVQ